MDDDIFARSAQLAYYFFFALFPALIFLTSLLGLFAGPGTKLHDSLLNYLATALPESAFELVQTTLDEIGRTSGGGKLGFGIVVTLWSAMSGMTALEDTLNAVHDVRERRPLWRRYGIALALTIVCSVLLISALAMVLYGNELANFIARHIGLRSGTLWTWKIAQWPLSLFFLAMVFSLIYYFCPDVDRLRWEWLTPGAVVGMTLWIVASFAFRVYLHYFNSYSKSYGSLGAVMVLLLWFYITGIMLLMGAEVNAEIERAATKPVGPDAKDQGRKSPMAPEPKSA
jgi:membrane protein